MPATGGDCPLKHIWQQFGALCSPQLPGPAAGRVRSSPRCLAMLRAARALVQTAGTSRDPPGGEASGQMGQCVEISLFATTGLSPARTSTRWRNPGDCRSHEAHELRVDLCSRYRGQSPPHRRPGLTVRLRNRVLRSRGVAAGCGVANSRPNPEMRSSPRVLLRSQYCELPRRLD